LKVGDGAFGLAYDSGKGEMFVTNAGDSTVSVISESAPSTTITSTSTTPASTSQTVTATQTSASGTTGGGGGIPEFPYQLVAAAVFTVRLAASYLLLRRRTTPRGDAGQEVPPIAR
jgi:DNA-binding beta-propeller fold protein YncE